MSKQTNDQQTVIQYLLGALPEAEAERLDELSLTDDEFADAVAAAEKDLVDAYVQGELAGADLDRFNSHYLASPRRRENVYFAQAFHAFAETNEPTPAAEVSADDTTSVATKRKRPGCLSALLGGGAPRPRWQWGAALAALALLVVGGWLAFERPRPRPQVARTQARQDASAQREQEPQNQPERERSANTQTSDEAAQARRREQPAQEPQQNDSQVSQHATNGQRQSKPPGRISVASF